MTASLTDAMLTLRYNLGPCDTWPEDVAAACRVIDAFVAGTTERNPMPAPALGMRVWVSAPHIGGATRCGNYDVHSVPGWPVTWSNWINEYDTIDLITDFRTGEVLWRRS